MASKQGTATKPTSTPKRPQKRTIDKVARQIEAALLGDKRYAVDHLEYPDEDERSVYEKLHEYKKEVLHDGMTAWRGAFDTSPIMFETMESILAYITMSFDKAGNFLPVYISGVGEMGQGIQKGSSGLTENGKKNMGTRLNWNSEGAYFVKGPEKPRYRYASVFLQRDYWATLQADWREYCLSVLLREQFLSGTFDDDGGAARIRRIEAAGVELLRPIGELGDKLVTAWKTPKYTLSAEIFIPAGLLRGLDGEEDDGMLRELVEEERVGDERWPRSWDAMLAELLAHQAIATPIRLFPVDANIEKMMGETDDILEALAECPNFPIFPECFHGGEDGKGSYLDQIILVNRLIDYAARRKEQMESVA